MTFEFCRWQPFTAVKFATFCVLAATVGFAVAVYLPPTYTVSVLLVTPGCVMAALPVRQRSFLTNTETWTGELPAIVVQPLVALTKKPYPYTGDCDVDCVDCVPSSLSSRLRVTRPLGDVPDAEIVHSSPLFFVAEYVPEPPSIENVVLASVEPIGDVPVESCCVRTASALLSPASAVFSA